MFRVYVACTLAMFDLLILKCFMLFYVFQISALDWISTCCKNPGKKDNTHIWKTNGSRVYGQKQYLLWQIRDILEILERNILCKESTFVFTFDTDLSFLSFYCFLKMHKQYIFNSKTTHYSRLCSRGPTSHV